MKPIYLKSGQTVAVVPMKKEPMWEEAPMLCDDGIWIGRYRYGNGDDWDVAVDEFEPPFRPGEKCYVPEAWDSEYDKWGMEAVRYKADGDEPFLGWNSPITMPTKHARRFVTIVSCEPVRVREITWQDALKTGIEAKYCCNGVDCSCMGLPIDNPVDDFLEQWHKRHPDHEWAWLTRTEEVKGG